MDDTSGRVIRAARLISRSLPPIVAFPDPERHAGMRKTHETTVATVSAVAAGACLLGYLLGRSGRQPQSRPEQMASAATAIRSQVPELDIRPVFRFGRASGRRHHAESCAALDPAPRFPLPPRARASRPPRVSRDASLDTVNHAGGASLQSAVQCLRPRLWRAARR